MSRIFGSKLFYTGILFIVVFIFSQSCDSFKEERKSQKYSDQPYKFIGSIQCKSCHANEFADWLKSDHFVAMQIANDSTVLGNFNDATYESDGVKNQFIKKDGKYFISTEGDDGINRDYEVKYTS
jgi:hypothetical protein